MSDGFILHFCISGREELIKSKLENPLVVADRVINDAVVQLEARSVVLEGK